MKTGDQVLAKHAPRQAEEEKVNHVVHSGDNVADVSGHVQMKLKPRSLNIVSPIFISVIIRYIDDGVWKIKHKCSHSDRHQHPR